MRRPFRGCRCRRSVWPAIALLLVTVMPLPARALLEPDLVTFPITGGPPVTFDITDPAVFLPLSLGSDYTFGVTFLGPIPFANAPEEILDWRGTANLLSVGEAPPGAEFLLVLTGLREGPTISDPRADAGFILSSFAGLGSDPIFVTDGSPGQITDVEGDTFLALRFPLVTGVPLSFDYQIQLVSPLQNPAEFTHFVRGFVIVPEAGSLLLLGVGLAGLVGLRLRRGA